MTTEKPYQRVNKQAPATDKPGLALPSISLSDNTKANLEAITKQMETASKQVAPSENISVNKIDEANTVDPLFDSMDFKPDVKIASIALRKAVEAKLKPISIDDLFISGEVRQRVDIIPGKLSVVFRSLRTGEDLYVKKRLIEVKTESARYAEERYLLQNMCCFIHEINGETFPPIMDSNDKIDDKAFEDRFNKISKLPQILLDRLWIHWRWFEDRVRKALDYDFLGNG
jgi:hypothetical protein